MNKEIEGKNRKKAGLYDNPIKAQRCICKVGINWWIDLINKTGRTNKISQEWIKKNNLGPIYRKEDAQDCS